MPRNKSDSDRRVYKVALFGVTGCGKSSIINLLAGKQMADVSTGVEACTRRAQWFPVSFGKKSFRVWDTMGFNQADVKNINPLSPYEQAHALLQSLQDGIDLILLCARRDGVNASLRNLYWLLDSFFFRGRAQMALVLTHFDVPDEDWWDRNVHVIAQKCNIPAQFLPHACITTIQNESSQSDSAYKQSKQALRALLRNHAVSSAKLTDLSSSTAIEDAAESLRTYCQLNALNAKTLVEHFRSPGRPFHAIIFGDTGSGKSSVINLISGKSAGPASISSGVESCTLSFCPYEINTGLHQFLVWDTVGFNGTFQGKDATIMALQNAARLVRDLHDKGGVDLLVFCKKGDRFSSSEMKCVKLFQEFLCEGQVPLAFIITHLESRDPMEKWWEENGEVLVKTCNLRTSMVAGHACVTAAQDNPKDQGLRNKRSLSIQQIQTMFEDSISYGDPFDKDAGIWVMSFLKRLVGMVKGSSTRKEKISVTKLMDCCGLTKEQAEELVKLLTSKAPQDSESNSLYAP